MAIWEVQINSMYKTIKNCPFNLHVQLDGLNRFFIFFLFIVVGLKDVVFEWLGFVDLELPRSRREV
jgi:hypothetical protein